MSTTEITTGNAEQYISQEGTLILDVWAPWCGPCRAFGPIFEKVAGRHTDLVWGKLNSQAEAGLAQALQIRAIPTLMVFRDGILLFRESGLLPEQALESLVEQVKALDMDDVRAKIAEADAKGEAEVAQ